MVTIVCVTVRNLREWVEFRTRAKIMGSGNEQRMVYSEITTVFIITREN